MVREIFKFLFSFLGIFYFFFTSPPQVLGDEDLPEIIIYSDAGDPLIDIYGNPTQDGIVLDRIKTYLDKLKLKHKTLSLPWNRLYRESQKKNNALVLELIRTDQRENKFHWLLPLIPKGNKLSLFALKESGLEAASKREILEGPYRALCKTKSAQCIMLRHYGFPDDRIIEVNNTKSINIEELILRHRADIMIDYNITVKSRLNSQNIPEHTIVAIAEIPTFFVYIAAPINFHKGLMKKILANREKYWDPILK